MSSKHNGNTSIIGRWKISKLLRKGRNTWIHEGIDIKNNKTVALKFISKADKTWIKQQTKQIETEIQALQNIRHNHVIRLYAYNINAEYPVHCHKNGNTSRNKNGSTSNSKQHIPTVLLVSEYATNGELFNLLYYTSGLNDSISRTYFKQMISAIECCHNKGIIHRDLRPKNILLNNRYNIKITNFSTSKIVKTDSDFLMKTKYFGGCRSYQSPQLLSDTSSYDFKCDIFSIGVILFILLSGYPPFEEATKNDKWYKQMIDKKYDRFWKYHQNAALTNDAKDLLNQMLAFDVKDRIGVGDIKKHEWFQGVCLGRFALQNAMQQRYNAIEHIRRQNIRRIENGTAERHNPSKPLPTIINVPSNVLSYTEPYKLVLFPLDKIECFEGGVYTFGWNNTRPIYDFISEIISSEGRGSCKYNKHHNKMYCKMKTTNNDEMRIKFVISIYQSRLWYNRYLESDDGIEEIVNNTEHLIYIACTQRIEGDELLYHKIKSEFLLERCSSIFKGLPQWARRMTPNIILDNYGFELLFNGYYAQDDKASIPINVIQLLGDFYRDKEEERSTDNTNDDYHESLVDFKW